MKRKQEQDLETLFSEKKPKKLKIEENRKIDLTISSSGKSNFKIYFLFIRKLAIYLFNFFSFSMLFSSLKPISNYFT